MDELIYNCLDSLPLAILFVIVGAMLFFLSKGADMLVDQAVSLSLRWGMPKIIIGATIISLGTTLPEATVSVLAAINGNPDLALGNAIGSIIADTGLIIGLAALLGHLPVERQVIKRQGKIQLLSGFLLALVCIPVFTTNRGNIPQWMGFIFILLLVLYIFFSIRWSKRVVNEAGLCIQTTQPTDEKIDSEHIQADKKRPLAVLMLKLIGGIILVVLSSKILIPSVEMTAIRIGIPQSIIAATLVALGTSLPELVTAITAVRKGHGELAVGNIVGADILNVLFVVGSAAAVTSGGLEVPIDFFKLQIPVMLTVLILFYLFSRSKKMRISKTEGMVLLVIYLAYIVSSYTWLRT